MFNGSDSLEVLIMSSNFLRYVPRSLPSSIYRLHLKSNKLEKIPSGVFDTLTQLRELYLQNNLLSNEGMENETFRTLRHTNTLDRVIQSLHLSAVDSIYPRLNTITVAHYVSMVITECINSKQRPIDLTTRQTMRRCIRECQLTSLEYLDLSNNNLSVVPQGLPRGLILLHLERNSIRSIPGDALTACRNLEYLLLHNNQLHSHSIHHAAFKGLKKLHTLHMYNNQLERVPRALPRRAKTLMLLHNTINVIERNDLVFLYTLTELNLSYNRLTSPKLHREAFRKLRLLVTLDLSGNALHFLPLGLPRSLQVLRVKDNQLNSIPEGALQGMAKLRDINLSHNQLRLNSIYQGAWMELSALTTLDLSSNQLSHIPSDLPESLEYLYLQSNHISTVPATAFEGTPNIKGIFLRFNHLLAHSVKESSFKHLTNLQVLDIGHSSHSNPSGASFRREEEEDEEMEIMEEEVGEGFAS
uniref:Podocan n=1 Tax=Hucho hucho TaxID=62062 RepID=A0A4W5QEZ8_9TELE